MLVGASSMISQRYGILVAAGGALLAAVAKRRRAPPPDFEDLDFERMEAGCCVAPVPDDKDSACSTASTRGSETPRARRHSFSLTAAAALDLPVRRPRARTDEGLLSAP
jgi:hypothetical protein